MEEFLKIDWTPSLDDIINNTFVSEERLEKESVMHRIMSGKFIDPFKDIAEDYKDITPDNMENIQIALGTKNADDAGEDNEGKTNNTSKKKEVIKRKCPYVPGIVRPSFKFPRKSDLNKKQQALCLRVLLRFSESNKPKMTQTEREEVQQYMDLQPLISKEQDQFLQVAKSNWQGRTLNIKCEDYINLRWKSKLQYIRKLPRHYGEVATIPFAASKNIEIKFISNCLQIGNLPKIVLPNFTRQYILRIKSDQLEERFPPKFYFSHKPSACFKLPVSEDPNCQKLAQDNNVDLVISSSGLNCLVNNIGPNYSNSWILPIVVKKHNNKNTIYVDKPAPQSASTIPEKNTWIYKYILKYFFISKEHSAPRSTEILEDNDIFGNINSEEHLKLEEAEKISNNISNNLHLNTSNVPEQSCTSDTNKRDTEMKGAVVDDEVEMECKSTTNSLSESIDQRKEGSESSDNNVSYNLFTIGPLLSEESELLKTTICKEYKILVRTKTDGYEAESERLLMLAPKLEHQVDLGAEAVTLAESLRQWASLIVRPHTFLARARISAETSEVLQIEHRTAVSINNEIKRLYNVKVEDSLAILHNIIYFLSNLSPGRYVIKHTETNGAFAFVYKEIDDPGKSVFDLHTVHGEQYNTIPDTPWLKLDKVVPTPMHKCFERMPAMFYPKEDTVMGKKGKCAGQKNSNTGTIRRSLRNKAKE